jgi:hypothetical protein
MCEGHQPNLRLSWKDNHEQPTQGGEAVGQALVAVGCCKGHTHRAVPLHVLHWVVSNRDGMLNMETSSCQCDGFWFLLCQYGKVGSYLGSRDCCNAISDTHFVVFMSNSGRKKNKEKNL